MPIEFIKPLEKPQGNYNDMVMAMFICKDDCKTILTPKNLMEMNQFAAELTSHELWFEFCIRNPQGEAIDGVGCGEESYQNMTATLTRATQLNENTTQEELDDAIKTFAPRALENPSARKAVSNNFTADWPFTPYITVFFKLTDRIVDSRIRKTLFGFYEETILRVYEDGEDKDS